MSMLQILMPMGGLGSRFSAAGFTTPKPLIEVDGLPMFRKALTSLDAINMPKRYLFVIRKEHAETLGLAKLITNALPAAEVVIIPELTNGATETAFAARDLLDPSEPLIVMDCDLWFSSKSYDQMVTSASSNPSAGVLTFEANSPRYSYAKINDDGYVTETAEKRVISEHAITGAYYFSAAQLFVSSAMQLLSQPLNEAMPEYYLSHLYNILIGDGVAVKAAYVDRYASFGTPEELREYEASGY